MNDLYFTSLVIVDVLAFFPLVVTCCQFDSKRIVSGSADGDARIWSCLTGLCLHVLSGHEGEVVSYQFVSVHFINVKIPFLSLEMEL